MIRADGRCASGTGLRVGRARAMLMPALKEHDAMARTILGIFIGALAASLVLTGCGYGFAELYRFPTYADFASPDLLADYAAATPASAIACVLGGWALGALIGGWIAAKIASAHRGAAAMVIGGLLTATVIVYASLMPNPEWMTVVGVLLPMPFAVIAALLATPRMQGRHVG